MKRMTGRQTTTHRMQDKIRNGRWLVCQRVREREALKKWKDTRASTSYVEPLEKLFESKRRDSSTLPFYQTLPPTQTTAG